MGVAVPHTRHPTLTRLIGTVALSRRGVDFAALDGEPVNIFFLLVSPQNQPGDHLRALENISRHLKDERFVQFPASGPDAAGRDRRARGSRPEFALIDASRRSPAHSSGRRRDDSLGSVSRRAHRGPSVPRRCGGLTAPTRQHVISSPSRPGHTRRGDDWILRSNSNSPRPSTWPSRFPGQIAGRLSPAQADRAADEPRHDCRPSPGRDHQ